MAPDTLWSRGPDGTQVHCQESGFRGSGVDTSTWTGTIRMSPLLDRTNVRGVVQVVVVSILTSGWEHAGHVLSPSAPTTCLA